VESDEAATVAVDKDIACFVYSRGTTFANVRMATSLIRHPVTADPAKQVHRNVTDTLK
jgi:hypothetical protein